MKRVTTLLAALCIIGSANAQKKNDYSIVKDGQPTGRFQQYVKHRMSLQSVQQAAAQKPTATGYRLIGIANLTDTYAPIDSTALKYSGTNGSTYDFNYMKYIIGDEFFGFTPNYHPYDFSSMPVKSDTATFYEFDGSNYSATNQYNANHLPNGKFSSLEKMYFNSNVPDGSDKYINVFDGQGKLQRMVYLENPGGAGYDSVGKIEYAYDNLGNKIVRDSLFDYNAGDWELSGVLQFTYTGSGLIDSLIIWEDAGAAGWKPSVAYVHLYDNSQRLIRVIGMQEIGAGLTPVVLDTFEYSGSLTYFKTLTEYTLDMSTSSFVPSAMFDKNINSSNLPDTMYILSYNSAAWDTVAFTSYQYNSNNNVMLENLYSNVAVLPLVMNVRYYYEPFTYTPASVAAVAPKATMVIYPNPTRSNVTLQWKEADGKRYQIELLNVAGQKILSQSFLWKEPQQQLSLESLTAGTYWIAVRNQEGAVIFHAAVQKQ